MVKDFIKPKYLKAALRDFAEHVRGLDKDELKKLDKSAKAQAKWCEDYSKENPELAMQDEPTPKKKGASVGVVDDDDKPKPKPKDGGEAPNLSSKGGQSRDAVNKWLKE